MASVPVRVQTKKQGSCKTQPLHIALISLEGSERTKGFQPDLNPGKGLVALMPPWVA